MRQLRIDGFTLDAERGILPNQHRIRNIDDTQIGELGDIEAGATRKVEARCTRGAGRHSSGFDFTVARVGDNDLATLRRLGNQSAELLRPDPPPPVIDAEVKPAPAGAAPVQPQKANS